eukprot:11978876-Alexandrium_andersonii.AAC.1
MCGSEHERQADVLRDDEVQLDYDATGIELKAKQNEAEDAANPIVMKEVEAEDGLPDSYITLSGEPSDGLEAKDTRAERQQRFFAYQGW